MIARFARSMAVSGILAAAVLGPVAPVMAGDRADRVQDWLTDISASVATAGYRLSWGELSTSLFGGDVTIRDIRGTDAAGAERLRIGRVTVEEAERSSVGALGAAVLTVESVIVSGPYAYTVGRIEIDRPDLDAVGDTIRRYVVQSPPTDPRPWSTRLAVERMEIEDLQGRFPTDDGPVDVAMARLLAVGVEPGLIGRLEIDDARQSGTGADGEQITTSMAQIRAEGVAIAPAVYELADDAEAARPFSALAGIGVGRFEIEDFRADSTLAGSSTVDRMWFRTRPLRSGSAGVLSFGSEGMRSQAGDAPTPFAPIVEALFPPDGEVPMRWTGEVAYDVERGFVGYRQEMTVEDFGSFNLQVDVSGIPNLSVAEWRGVSKGDPRLAALQINGISLSLTDTGGIDRTVVALAADKTVPAARLRDAIAEQIGTLVTGLTPKTDPRLLRWLAVLQDFVRLGGTLAFGMTKPIPIGDVRAPPAKVKDLSELAARYGLAVVRR